MLIFALDDEPKMLRLLHEAIAEAAPDAVVKDFSLGTEAIAAIETEGLMPDVVFSDIRMPKLDGLQLAVRLKTLAPDTKIVFVTGYSEYALDAFRVRAHGYLTVIELNIPSEIDGYTVTGIDDNAFRKSYIQSVIIPDSVTSIRFWCKGNYTFFNNDIWFHQKI